MEAIDKRVIVREVREQLAREILALTNIANAAREAATHEEARPENDKDTRAIEAAYLAGAQAERVAALKSADVALAVLDPRSFAEGDPIAIAALVEVEHDAGRSTFFLAPAGGGLRATSGERRIDFITPQSPMGQALLGRSAGDVVEVMARGKMREYEIVDVR